MKINGEYFTKQYKILKLENSYLFHMDKIIGRIDKNLMNLNKIKIFNKNK